MLWLLEATARELMLFAAVLLAIGGVDELIVDLLWIGRTVWRRVAVHSRFGYTTAATLARPAAPGRIAVFVAAWAEGAVIGPMLRHALAAFDHADYRIYLGCYPNDPGTLDVVRPIAAADPRLRLALNPRPGPTTKADALNGCWRQLLADEAAGIM